MKGRITKIERKTYTATAVSTGYKKPDQKNIIGDAKWHPENGGGNKVQLMESTPAIEMTIHVYGENGQPDQRIQMDIRNSILETNGLKKVSKQKFDKIVEDNRGKKVEFDITDKKIKFKPGDLKL